MLSRRVPEVRLPPDPQTREAGGDNRARTGDLLRAKQALSQLSYIPETLQRVWWA
jgi:hypothetical protein